MRIIAAQLIEEYRGPEYLVRPIPQDAVDREEELEAINSSLGLGEIVETRILGWPPYDAILKIGGPQGEGPFWYLVAGEA